MWWSGVAPRTYIKMTYQLHAQNKKNVLDLAVNIIGGPIRPIIKDFGFD